MLLSVFYDMRVEQAYDRLPEPDPYETNEDGDHSPCGGDAGGGEDDHPPDGANCNDESTDTCAGPDSNDPGQDGGSDAC